MAPGFGSLRWVGVDGWRRRYLGVDVKSIQKQRGNNNNNTNTIWPVFEPYLVIWVDFLIPIRYLLLLEHNP